MLEILYFLWNDPLQKYRTCFRMIQIQLWVLCWQMVAFLIMSVCMCNIKRDVERERESVWNMTVGTDGGLLPKHCKETVCWLGHERLHVATKRETCSYGYFNVNVKANQFKMVWNVPDIYPSLDRRRCCAVDQL